MYIVFKTKLRDKNEAFFIDLQKVKHITQVKWTEKKHDASIIFEYDNGTTVIYPIEDGHFIGDTEIVKKTAISYSDKVFEKILHIVTNPKKFNPSGIIMLGAISDYEDGAYEWTGHIKF